jgi:hypothetical protein
VIEVTVALPRPMTTITVAIAGLHQPADDTPGTDDDAERQVAEQS